MTLAKKTANPPAGFKIAYSRTTGTSDWSAFGMQRFSPIHLERVATLDPDVWVQYGNCEGRDVIYVRVK
ncbi:hypothetical protein [Acetobacter cerevisiae]|uniref:Uncharacterized protein n=1 Tax=Acetobacter cerevisiae TaxID=178900 RepID=A0A149Q7N4_9PROT|nr:hypothetical protein [Acetobacter cerevisiae]KXU93325.1 hypothetical protein AD928_09130 [Acetobacter cerevisiae]GBQ10416.1 hypothetical protein AA14362_2544 [Acetobacter cerevisiae DSM 14362]